MSYLSVARAAIAAKGAAIPGIKYAYPRMPDTIAGSPALVLGQFTWTTIPGDRERTTYTFELGLYVEWNSEDDQAIAEMDDMLDLVQEHYAKGITLGQTGETTECDILGGVANESAQIGDTIYLNATIRLVLKASRQRGYTA